MRARTLALCCVRMSETLRREIAGSGWVELLAEMVRTPSHPGVPRFIFHELQRPADSPIKSMKEVVEQLKKDPGSVKWGGGSRGSTEHIAAAMIAREVGVDPAKINYVAFRGGGEATAAILGGNVTVGGSGFSEFQQYIESGKMRVLAVTSSKRLPGPLAIGPTWPELGYKGVFENWRGVIGTKGMTADQTGFWENVFRRIVESGEFRKLAEKNQWDANFKTAAETRKFMESQYGELKEVMTFLGLAK